MNQTTKETQSKANTSNTSTESSPHSDSKNNSSEAHKSKLKKPAFLKSKASKLWLLFIIVILLIAAWFGLAYLHYSDQFLSTQDAYIGGNQTQISSQVSGLIQTAPWQNNKDVKKGDILFTLDPTPFRIAVKEAKAGLATAERQQKTANAAITTARAELQRQEASAQQAQDHLHRLTNIKNKQFVSAQALSDARSALAVAKAAVAQAHAQLSQTKTSAGAQGAQNARIKAAQAKLAKAQYNLSKTVVRAPMSGRLANYSIEPGQNVNADQTVCSIVATTGLWVDANFKATELGAIQIGQSARIESNIYPNHVIKGHVLSIAAGSGNAFSLLPPQNATGNWVKVTQRVPVRIIFDNNDPKNHLPIGTGTSTRIVLVKHPQSFWGKLLGVIGLDWQKKQTSPTHTSVR